MSAGHLLSLAAGAVVFMIDTYMLIIESSSRIHDSYYWHRDFWFVDILQPWNYKSCDNGFSIVTLGSSNNAIYIKSIDYSNTGIDGRWYYLWGAIMPNFDWETFIISTMLIIRLKELL